MCGATIVTGINQVIPYDGCGVEEIFFIRASLFIICTNGSPMVYVHVVSAFFTFQKL
jgi:hypothetical protein